MSAHVLGISAFYHDAAACLLRDGEVVMAVEEERLSRQKHDRRYPSRAIACCLEAGGIGPSELDAVVFYEKTLPKLERQIDTWVQTFPRSLARFTLGLTRYLGGRVDLRRWLERESGFTREILFSEHHLSHAAETFYSSPFERATVLVADGVGEWATTSVWRAGPDGIVPEREIHFPDSLGLFYSLVTAHLGFRVNEDEYKVMGLAAYGQDAYAEAMSEILALAPDGSFRLDRRVLDLAATKTLASAALAERLGPARAPGAPIEARHRDVARSAQVRLEEALLGIERTLPEGPLCFSGGVALNGAANAKLRARRPLHVSFAPGDSGGAIGAAHVGHHLGLGHARTLRRASPYLGPSFDAERCLAAVHSAGRRARALSELGGDAHVTRALASGRVLGFFDGAMELGPRALGHRSILADPRDAAMRDVINARIKHREPFRPFAPAVPEERASEFFEVDHPVPWMTEIHPARVDVRAKIPAVVHVDGTARVQTVSASDAPRLHALLHAFEAEAGIPVLLNTSFNVAGEPIVCTPEDALRCAVAAQLDALVLGPYWIEELR